MFTFPTSLFSEPADASMELVYDTSLSAGTTIEIPLAGTVDVEVDWGDGNSDSYATAGNKSHTYASDGTYTVSISGLLTAFGGTGVVGIDKLIEVASFGDLGVTSFENAFNGTSNLASVPSSIPSGVTNMGGMFRSSGFSGDLSGWDVSSVTDMSFMFYHSPFNGSLAGWDVSNVADFGNMFRANSVFNQDLSTWNTSGATSMLNMFMDATSFNGDVTTWDVSNVTDMRNMFKDAAAFNQPIGGWTINPVGPSVSGMFEDASLFNQPLNSWDVSGVTSMVSMFQGASDFNRDLSSWDVSSVTSMDSMFRGASAFNGDITTWTTTSLTNMQTMFYLATSFNQNIDSWDVSNVTNMRNTFYEASSFNQDLNSWDVSSVTDMTYMFRKASAFNGNITSWNVSNVTRFFYTFAAMPFNQDISGWVTSAATNMKAMFYNNSAFNQDIGSWDVSNVTNMKNMFSLASSFDQDISGWDVSSVTDLTNFFNSSGLSTANYDALLTAWEALPGLQGGVTAEFGESKYTHGSAAATARDNLINTHGWTITDGGMAQLVYADFSTPVAQSKPSSATGVLSGRTASYIWRCEEAPGTGSITDEVAGQVLNASGDSIEGQKAIGLWDGSSIAGWRAIEAGSPADEWITPSNFLDTADSVRVLVVFRDAGTGLRLFLHGTTGTYALAAVLSGQIRLFYGDGSTSSTFDLTGDYQDGAWHCVEFTFDRNAGTIRIASEKGEASTAHPAGTCWGSTKFQLCRSDGLGAQIAYCAVFTGADAEGAEGASEFWKHATDPSGLLTTYTHTSALYCAVDNDATDGVRVATYGADQFAQFWHSSISIGDGFAAHFPKGLENLFPHSCQTENWSTSSANISVSAAVTDLVDDPRGLRYARKVTASAANEYIYETITVSGGSSQPAMVMLKRAPGGGTVDLELEHYDATNGTVIDTVVITLDDDRWRQLQMAPSQAGTETSCEMRIRITTAGGGSFFASGATTWEEPEPITATDIMHPIFTAGATASTDVVEAVIAGTAGEFCKAAAGEMVADALCYINDRTTNAWVVYASDGSTDHHARTLRTANTTAPEYFVALARDSAGGGALSMFSSKLAHRTHREVKFLWDAAGIHGSGDTGRIYLDGSLNDTAADALSPSDVLTEVQIGGRHLSTNPMRGAVAKLEIHAAPVTT